MNIHRFLSLICEHGVGVKNEKGHAPLVERSGRENSKIDIPCGNRRINIGTEGDWRHFVVRSFVFCPACLYEKTRFIQAAEVC